MKTSQRLIESIKARQIKPAPKAFFRIREGLTWAAFILAVFLGALAFSVILFSIQQTEFYILRHLSHSRLEMFLGILPFAWIAFLAFFLALSIFSFRKSERGYKFRMIQLAGYSFAFSVLLGTVFFLAGGAQRIEHAFALRVAIYESMQEKKARIWSMPEQGYLSGVIESSGPDEFKIKAFDDKIWTISYADAFIAPVLLLEPGEIIKLSGKMTASDRFEADTIRPYGGPEFRGRRR